MDQMFFFRRLARKTSCEAGVSQLHVNVGDKKGLSTRAEGGLVLLSSVHSFNLKLGIIHV